MRILLLGEYSNVHWTLAEGLRGLGHEVCVVSDGDDWKGYQRDLTLRRKSLGKLDTLAYYIRAWHIISKCRGYDIVQIINPMFLELRANKILPFYKFLRQHNKHLIMCAFGMDYYWVKTGLDCKTFRYSDFNIGNTPRTSEPFNQAYINEWMDGEKRQLNEFIAKDADAIVTGLCEYDMCYRPLFPQKTTFIPFPIHIGPEPEMEMKGQRMRIFIGIQKTRSAYKGTDIMLRALEKVKEKYPEKFDIVKVESVPFEQYKQLMNSADVLIDQLYSYTPAMNALQAMSQGLIVVGGGEPENYEILGETQLKPIINVLPDEDDCYKKIEQLILHPECIPQLKRDGYEYVKRHHDHIKVAQRYEYLYRQLFS